MSSRPATPISSGKRVASRSSSIAWTFDGSATATRSVPLSSAYGIATTRSRTWSGTCFAASSSTGLTARSTSGSWKRVASDAGDALARRDALVEDRLRERTALLGATADERELVGRDEAGGGQEVDHELGDRVDRHAAAERLCAALEALVPDGAERRRLLLFELVHRFNPSNELSAQPPKVLSTFGG